MIRAACIRFTNVVVVLAAIAWASCARAQEVDLELVLTVDVSLSMDLDEQRVQRSGYVQAFRDPEIWKAIASGPTGRIAVAYVEWAGFNIQETVIPWTLIDGPEAALSFADVLEAKPISRGRMTSISAVIRYAMQEFERNPYRGARRVIDVSGDGPNNVGGNVASARDEAVKAGIVINGLPIQIKVGGPNSLFDMTDLDRYFIDCVVGGPGSFVLPVRERDQLPAAIRKKLILEISNLTPPQEPRIVRTQFATPSPQTGDCLAGERRWEDYMRGRIRE